MIPMLKIRRSHDHLIFNMGIPIPEKDGLYIETGPWSQVSKGIRTLGQLLTCLFLQLLVQVEHIKKWNKAEHYRPFVRCNQIVLTLFTSQRASNSEIVSMSQHLPDLRHQKVLWSGQLLNWFQQPGNAMIILCQKLGLHFMNQLFHCNLKFMWKNIPAQKSQSSSHAWYIVLEIINENQTLVYLIWHIKAIQIVFL